MSLYSNKLLTLVNLIHEIMRRVIFLFLIVFLLSCKKDTEPIDNTPEIFCWRCALAKRTWIYNCSNVSTGTHSEVIYEQVCNMTENDAKIYEKTGVQCCITNTITGKMDNKPCDYLRLETMPTSRVCTKLGVN